MSKSMRGRRLAIAMARLVSLTRSRPASPGIPARNVIRVVAPEGRPETQSVALASDRRALAGGSSRTQSAAWKSSRRIGATVKSTQARGGSVSGWRRRGAPGCRWPTRLVQFPHDRLVVGRAFSRTFQRLDRLRRPVQHLQRLSAMAGRGGLARPRRSTRGISRRPARRGWRLAACGASAPPAPVPRHLGLRGSPTPRRPRPSPRCGSPHFACSTTLRATGVPPAGKREVRVRASSLLSTSRPGRLRSPAHAVPHAGRSSAASSNPKRDGVAPLGAPQSKPAAGGKLG